MRRIAFILAAAVIVTGVILWPRHSSMPEPGAIRNVLLISLDTTRADHLGCYGHPGSTTPNIDALAAGGVLFENVTAPVPLTLPSHVSMLTGTTPPYHGVHDNLFTGLRPGIPTLAEVLRDDGFRTGAIVSALPLHRMYGLDRGFETYQDGFAHADAAERTGDETTRLAVEWLDRNGGERFFLFLHYYDPHFEYAPPEPFASRFPDDPYAGEIAFTDDCVGKVVARLKALGLYDSTLIVVAGDHGEMLGEHGESAHGYYIYRSALEVPLILHGPGLPDGRRVRAIAGVVDVTPTICGLLGIDPPSPRQGIDLSPVIGGDRYAGGDRYVYCESLTPTKYLATGLWGLVGERWKYIQTSRPELYDLPADPGEQQNVVSANPQVAEPLHARLAQAVAAGEGAAAELVSLDEQTVARLQSLGYVGGAVDAGEAMAIDPDAADPKDLVDFHNRVVEFQYMLAQGRLDEAAQSGETLLALRPDVPVVLEGMCSLALRQKRYDDATEYCGKALAIDPDQFAAARDLGEAQAALGHLDEAIEAYAQAIRIRSNAPRVHYNLAHAYYQRGEMDPCLEHLKASAELNPDVPAVQVSLAATYRELGRYEEAIEHYYKVIELEPDSPRNLDALAWLLATSAKPSGERTAEAVRFATRACRITNFTVPGAVETLAAALAADGDFPGAIKHQKAVIAQYRDPERLQKAQTRLALYEAGVLLEEGD